MRRLKEKEATYSRTRQPLRASDRRHASEGEEGRAVRGGATEAPDCHAPGNSACPRWFPLIVRRHKNHDRESGEQKGFTAIKPVQMRLMCAS